MAVIHDLADIAVVDERRVYRSLSLENDVINELAQVRRTKPSDEESERMMESFLSEGQLVPGIVAALTSREAGQYVQRINFLWQTSYALRQLKRIRIEGKTYYLILVAGHMRHQIGRLLYELYRDEKIESLGNFNARYYAELRFGLRADEAIRIQIHENIRNQLHDADEVYAAWLVWEWKRHTESSFTKAELGRMFGRTAGWVREALLFMELPEQIQELAFPSNNDTPKVVKTLLIQVAWYADQRAQMGLHLSEEDKLHEVARAVAAGLTPEQYREQAKQKIQHLSNEGGTQGAMSFLDAGHVEPTQPIRKVAAKPLLLAALSAKTYLQKLREIREMGGFGNESPYEPLAPGEAAEYSVGSPVRIIGEMARLLGLEAYHFEQLAKTYGGGRGRPLIVDSQENLARAEKALSTLTDVEQSE